MNQLIKHGLRFIFFVLVQVLILNQMEVGWGTQLMIYPLFIALLPVELGMFSALIVSFVLGLCIDMLSDTYGLHASSAVVVAYLRPMIYKLFSPRDGYDQIEETTVHEMGFSWFLKAFGLLLFIHHLWFFLLEIFKINETLFVLQKTFLSAPMSFVICVLLQYLFLRTNRKKA